MRPISLIRNAFLLISAGCLAAAYLLGGHWLIAPVLLASVGFWLSLRRFSVLWRSSCLMTSYVVLAAVGTAIGLSVAFMVVGTAAALAAWDLTNFAEKLRIVLDSKNGHTLQRSHVQSLLLGLSLGTFLALASSSALLDLPISVVGVLAIALIASLVRAAEHLGGAKR